MRPPLCILLLTYSPDIDHPRSKYAEQTLISVLDNIQYEGEIRVHIADDGSPEEHREKLRQIAGGYAFVTASSSSNSERGGYGANYNIALQTIHSHSSIIMPIEDDWNLNRSLNLNELVDSLEAGSPYNIGCIRLGYLGYTQELSGRLVKLMDKNFLLFDPNSAEPHVWAGHPRIETRDYQRRMMPWPEGIDPGTTEFVVAHRQEVRKGVVWPLDIVRGYGDLFSHIGAVQARSDQVAV